ncbi:hypothetical protein SAMN05661080_01116 [Modestobacter sp. DSM 44400]|uniref:hypothetical protein n=1 Tax=Modestobacter sp. DSM 44400 TaxID=1550230 RepID=UPI000896B275|nr:hypothetical protein [Modestobacter sp. DSM 44400]SDX76373.1 hypothetical protein SAMN05661080_01116 [Modestobacter sp. DSM 44400]
MSTPQEPDDPGRDPEGLDPPRDILDAPGATPEKGSYQPHRPTQPRDRPSDEPPTSTEGGGP